RRRHTRFSRDGVQTCALPICIPPERVAEHVFGYMLLNDVTARDLQQRGPQWFLGKSCDTFCPTGPWILLADPAVPQPDIEIRVRSDERRVGIEGRLLSVYDMS